MKQYVRFSLQQKKIKNIIDDITQKTINSIDGVIKNSINKILNAKLSAQNTSQALSEFNDNLKVYGIDRSILRKKPKEDIK